MREQSWTRSFGGAGPHIPKHGKESKNFLPIYMVAVAQVAERLAVAEMVGGSSPLGDPGSHELPKNKIKKVDYRPNGISPSGLLVTVL